MSIVAREPIVGTEPKLRVFLSYSRKDADFVTRLGDALVQRGYLADFDQSAHRAETGDTGIAPSDEWWIRLENMIAGADVMVLVVSPDSALSKVVDEEITYARSLAKRIIAITCRQIDFNTVPPRLSALNVSHWFVQKTFDEAISKLCAALDRDVDWLRDSSSYTIQAKAWKDANLEADKLLHGIEIAAAQTWAARRPQNIEVSELVHAYIEASRIAQARRDKSRRAVGRVIVGLVATAFAITIVGAWFVIDGQRNLARSQSLFLARAAEQAAQTGDYLRGLRLSVLAARESFLAPSTPEARAQLAANAQALNMVASFHTGEPDKRGWALSADGTLLFVSTSESEGIIWDFAASREISRIHPAGNVADGDALFLAGATVLVTRSDGDAVQIWTVATGESRPAPEGLSGGIAQILCVPLGTWVNYTECRTKDDAFLAYDKSGRVRAWQASGVPVGSGVTPQTESNLIGSIEGGVLVSHSRQSGKVEIFDVISGQRLRAEPSESVELTGAALSSDGTLLALAGITGNIEITQTRSGTHVATLPASGADSMKFSKDGKRLLSWFHQGLVVPATGPDAEPGDLEVRGFGAQLWDTATSAKIGDVLSPLPEYAGLPPAELFFGNNSLHPAFSEDDRRVLILEEEQVGVWDAVTGELEFFLSPPQAEAFLAVSPDWSQILVSNEDTTVSLWTLGGGQVGSPIAPYSNDLSAAFLGGQNHIITFSPRTGELREWRLPLDRALGAHARMLPDGRILAWGERGSSQFFAADGTPESRTLEEAGEWIHEIAVSPSGGQVLGWGTGLQPFIWDGLTGKLAGAELQVSFKTRGGAFSADGSKVAVWGWYSSFSVLSVKTGETVGVKFDDELAKPNAEEGLEYLGVAVAPDLERILTFHSLADSGAEMARLWDGVSGAEVAKLTTEAVSEYGEEGREYGRQYAAIQGAAFSENGKLLTWGSAIPLQLWDARTGAPIVWRQLRKRGGAKFVDGGRRILTWDDMTEASGAVILDTDTGLPVSPTFADDGRADFAALSRDGRFVATLNSGKGSILVWDAHTGIVIAAKNVRGASFVEFSPDGRNLLIEGRNGASLFDISWATRGDGNNEVIQSACALKLAGSESDAFRPDIDDKGEATYAPVLNRRSIQLRGGARRLDDKDAELAPILRGQEGKDTCDWSRSWYDAPLRLLLGWAFP